MSRIISDADGKQWDVHIGRESYGMLVLLFSPRGGGEVRKAMMASSTRIEAQQELETLDEAALRERLQTAVPWEASHWGG